MTIEESAPAERPEDEKLGLGANLAYGLQHVLTMYGGIVAVPLIVGQAAGLGTGDVGLLITASLFAGGLATILQTMGLPFFGCRLPLVLQEIAGLIVLPDIGPQPCDDALDRAGASHLLHSRITVQQ